MKYYSPDRLPIAAMIILIGIASIVFRRRIARATNGLYNGLGIKLLVRTEAAHSAGQLISGVVLVLIGSAVAMSGFFE